MQGDYKLVKICEFDFDPYETKLNFGIEKDQNEIILFA